jgi:hypothetical protein
MPERKTAKVVSNKKTSIGIMAVQVVDSRKKDNKQETLQVSTGSYVVIVGTCNLIDISYIVAV